MTSITLGSPIHFTLGISRERSAWNSIDHPNPQPPTASTFSQVEQLEICESLAYHIRKDNLDMDAPQWLGLLHLFSALQSLYVSKRLVPLIAAALSELTKGRVMEVIPTLRNLFLEELQPSGPAQESMSLFVATRQSSDHPVAVHDWAYRIETLLRTLWHC
jgi:hypothetical protein